jgi:hypothetical protein
MKLFCFNALVKCIVAKGAVDATLLNEREFSEGKQNSRTVTNCRTVYLQVIFMSFPRYPSVISEFLAGHQYRIRERDLSAAATAAAGYLLLVILG